MTGTELRPATSTDADADADAEIWHRGWRDGHLGNVPDAVAAHRSRESFADRAAARLSDATVAVARGEVAGPHLLSPEGAI